MSGSPADKIPRLSVSFIWRAAMNEEQAKQRYEDTTGRGRPRAGDLAEALAKRMVREDEREVVRRIKELCE
jgi:hypothetical protein